MKRKRASKRGYSLFGENDRGQALVEFTVVLPLLVLLLLLALGLSEREERSFAALIQARADVWEGKLSNDASGKAGIKSPVAPGGMVSAEEKAFQEGLFKKATGRNLSGSILSARVVPGSGPGVPLGAGGRVLALIPPPAERAFLSEDLNGPVEAYAQETREWVGKRVMGTPRYER